MAGTSRTGVEGGAAGEVEVTVDAEQALEIVGAAAEMAADVVVGSVMGEVAEMAVDVVVGSVMGEVAEAVAGAVEAVGATEVEIWSSGI